MIDRTQTSSASPLQQADDFRAQMLIEIAKWMVPPTKREAMLVAELSAQPRIRVEAIHPDLRKHLGMRLHDCHRNCRDFVRDERSDTFRHVAGWRIENGLYILHSIVSRPGETICITPMLQDGGDAFDFIPEPGTTFSKHRFEITTFLHCNNSIRPRIRSPKIFCNWGSFGNRTRANLLN